MPIATEIEERIAVTAPRGFPFASVPEMPPYESIAARAYRASLNDDGLIVLPATWNDDDEQSDPPVEEEPTNAHLR